MILRKSFFRCKRGIASSSRMGMNLGYYAIAVLMVSILFVFLSIIISGVRSEYFRSDFGAGVEGLNDRLFMCLALQDEITGTIYPKIIDIEKYNSFDIDSCIGIPNKGFGSRGVRLELKNKDSIPIGNKDFVETSNYGVSEDFYRDFPVLVYGLENNKEHVVANLRVYYWNA